ncbi:MAG: cob(I)yrinic acid a,c-diamide adenosyltransferase [Candidatus Woesearchaeota archaeon]
MNNSDILAIKEKLGKVHIITGNGKGKTTSGMGMVTRALGRGLKVKIIQLFKRDTGEQYFFDNLKSKNIPVEYVQFQPLHPYFKKYTPENFESLKTDFKKFWNDAISDIDKYDEVFIDEVGPGINWKVIDEQMIIDLINNKPKHLELIMTGRDFPQSLHEHVDYVSEINLVKHPYEKGILARKGIEY